MIVCLAQVLSLYKIPGLRAHRGEIHAAKGGQPGHERALHWLLRLPYDFDVVHRDAITPCIVADSPA